MSGGSSNRWRGLVLVGLAAMAGLVLQVDTARRNSATYDEPTYLRVASRWWQSGTQDEITRMGTPLTFWKLQYAPVFLLLELTGRGRLVHEAIGHEKVLLPMARIGSLWIWLAAFSVTAWWSRRLYGPRAMAFAAWLFALSPNLIAHGALTTMEMPLTATTAGLFALFWMFLETRRWRWFWGAAIVCGLAWSCKFTTILYPPILALAWWLDRRRQGNRSRIRLTVRVALGMVGFVLVAMLANFAITGFAMIPLSPTRLDHPSLIRALGEVWGRRLARVYEIPLPQDWVGFANQIMHQAGGGASYLFGERRMKGWWYYYFIALAVKVPITFFVLMVARSWLATGSGDPRRTEAEVGDRPNFPRRTPSDEDASGSWKMGLSPAPRAARGDPREADDQRPRRDSIIPLTLACFLTITALASSRNYGIRYLLPLAPLAIVWVSALAELPRWNRLLIPIGLVGAGLATAASHPYELTYFNMIAGGPIGGRRILSDSNLDWGQGLLGLARLQRDEPEFRDLTLYYFGDTDPDHYGIFGLRCVITAVGGNQGLPELDALKTRYVGVSASLQWGPWGTPGFFDCLKGVAPVRMTDDTTIAIYRVSDIPPVVPAGQ